MPPNPLDLARHLFGPDLESLSGALVTGEIPLTTTVINRLIADKLRSRPAPVESVRLEAHDDEAFTVHVGLRPPLPALRVAARIIQQPQFPHAPTLGIEWRIKGLGPLAMFAAPALSLLKALPPGVTADGEHVRVDIPTVLRGQGLGELVPLMAGLRILTRGGRVIVQFELRR